MTAAMPNVVEHGGLAAGHVPMEEAAVHRLLHDHYGIEGSLTRFETEKDDTFRVTRKNGERLVLKIANPEETLEEIDFQNCLMRHAAMRDPELPIPAIVPDVDGNSTFRMTDADGSARFVRALTYLEGTPLCETESDSRERVRIGRMLGRLRLATEGFSHPAEDRKYAWDVQHLLTLESLLDEVDNPDQRAALAAGLERFRMIEPEVRTLRRQVLHNDFSKSNIIVDHGEPQFVTGVIDFGDSVKTAIAIDVSTACLNQLPESPHEDLFWRAREIVAGYLQVATLTDQELSLIPHLTLARVVTRALLTSWRAKRFPGNERYIMRNTYQGWHQLDWFLARHPDEASELLVNCAMEEGRL